MVMMMVGVHLVGLSLSIRSSRNRRQTESGGSGRSHLVWVVVVYGSSSRSVSLLLGAVYCGCCWRKIHQRLLSRQDLINSPAA